VAEREGEGETISAPVLRSFLIYEQTVAVSEALQRKGKKRGEKGRAPNVVEFVVVLFKSRLGRGRREKKRGGKGKKKRREARDILAPISSPSPVWAMVNRGEEKKKRKREEKGGSRKRSFQRAISSRVDRSHVRSVEAKKEKKKIKRMSDARQREVLVLLPLRGGPARRARLNRKNEGKKRKEGGGVGQLAAHLAA